MGRVGCRFAPRCELAFDRCYQEDPELFMIGNERKSRCFLYDDNEKDAMNHAKAHIGS